MPKTALTKDEIKELSNLISEVFEYLSNLRSRNQLANSIQYSKIPPTLSESIVMHLINDRKILGDLRNIKGVKFGGNKGDILISTNDGEHRIKLKRRPRALSSILVRKISRPTI